MGPTPPHLLFPVSATEKINWYLSLFSLSPAFGSSMVVFFALLGRILSLCSSRETGRLFASFCSPPFSRL